jgi:hypothetical protein
MGLDEDEVRVEIADGVEVRVARRAVAGVMPEEDEEGGEEPLAEDAEPSSETRNTG